MRWTITVPLCSTHLPVLTTAPWKRLPRSVFCMYLRLKHGSGDEWNRLLQLICVSMISSCHSEPIRPAGAGGQSVREERHLVSVKGTNKMEDDRPRRVALTCRHPNDKIGSDRPNPTASAPHLFPVPAGRLKWCVGQSASPSVIHTLTCECLTDINQT